MTIRVLFIHQNFPGQFKHVASRLSDLKDFEVRAIGRDTAKGLPGVKITRYKPGTRPKSTAHPFLVQFEDAVAHGSTVARVLEKFRSSNWCPDVVIAHPGWGEALFIKDVFPDCRLINFCEYYYHAHGADSGFDPEFALSRSSGPQIRVRNALHLTNLENCDLAVTPTRWQHSLHPKAYQRKIRIIHEGIDTTFLKPNPGSSYSTSEGEVFHAQQEIVTFVSRNLEPYRGFHTFMRALKNLMNSNKNCIVLIVGGDGVSYGRKPTGFSSWREKMLNELNLDTSRIRFLGKVPYNDYVKILQISRVHVYLTYPFVLSWSMLEAMSCGCLIIASKTAPVQEYIQDKENGLLVDFFDHAQLATTIDYALKHPKDLSHLRTAARNSVLHLSLERSIDNYLNLISSP